jgi:hypothetical protein
VYIIIILFGSNDNIHFYTCISFSSVSELGTFLPSYHHVFTKVSSFF